VAVAGGALFERRWPRRPEVAAAVVVLACTVAAYLAATPFTLLDWPGFAAQFGEQRRVFAGLQDGSIIGPARAALGGQRGWLHYAAFTLPHGVGLPLLLASVAGASWLVARRHRQALLLLSFPFAYYASMGFGQLVYARNMVPMVPFLCIAAAVLVDEVAASRWVSRSAHLPAAAAVAVSLALAAPTAADSIAFDRLVARTDTRVLGSRWVEVHFPAGAAIFQTGIYYGRLQPRPGALFRPVGFDGRRAAFAGAGGAPASPEVVVRLDSPLFVYNRVPDGLAEVLARGYVLAQVFPAGPPGPRKGVYDQQDAWYAPFADLGSATRPGPDVSIYVRRVARESADY
jgi:hypothetical protein